MLKKIGVLVFLLTTSFSNKYHYDARKTIKRHTKDMKKSGITHLSFDYDDYRIAIRNIKENDMSRPKGQRKKYVSKGERPNVSKKLKLKGFSSVAAMWINLKDAWARGKNPWLTIENPNKEETNKRMIRVRANDHWGLPKAQKGYMIR